MRGNLVGTRVGGELRQDGADDLGNMFQFKRDFNADFVGARDLSLARELNPELKDFDTWLAANADRIPVG